jgi:membrane associated rhomboid family serine protease
MFIPLGDDNSRRHSFPLVVLILIVLNGFMWKEQLVRGDKFTLGYSFVPFELTHWKDLSGLFKLPNPQVNKPIHLYPGPPFIPSTIFYAMFMHGSWGHICGNMLYLWIFGDQVEDYLGKLHFVFFYLLCGVGATAAYYLVNPDSIVPTLGASGAIAGVLGAYLVLHPTNRIRVLLFNSFILMPAWIVLGSWFVMQFVGQFGAIEGGGGVAYMAHIGGFVVGAGYLKLVRSIGAIPRGY